MVIMIVSNRAAVKSRPRSRSGTKARTITKITKCFVVFVLFVALVPERDA